MIYLETADEICDSAALLQYPFPAIFELHFFCKKKRLRIFAVALIYDYNLLLK